MTSIICLIETILTQPIQIQLSQKEKTFSQFLFAFLKSIFNFKHLLKNDETTETTWRNEFRSNYLKNKKIFLKIFLHFHNLY